MNRQNTISKRELRNLQIMARIVRCVYDDPFCSITFISKRAGIPQNTATVRKFLSKLLDTGYFKSTFPWNNEGFYINKFSDPIYLLQRTFFIKKHEMSMFFDSNEYLSRTNAYKEFTNLFKVNHIARLGKDNFKKTHLTYHKDLKLNQDSRDQILRKLLCIYHKKMLIYLKEEKYQSKKLPYVRVYVHARMQDVTRFILKYVAEFAKKINPYDESEFLKFAKEISTILDMEYETTSAHLINSMEYLTTITDKSNRKIRTLNERIEFWQDNFDVYFDPENPRNTPYHIARILGPIMKKDGTPDFAKMTQISAAESGCDAWLVENCKIEEFFWQWSEKHPLDIELNKTCETRVI